jgi:hypothetical protein
VNVVIEWITFLLRIWELLGSYIGPETGYHNWGVLQFSSVPRDKCWDSTLHSATTASFHILSNSSFTYHLFCKLQTTSKAITDKVLKKCMWNLNLDCPHHTLACYLLSCCVWHDGQHFSKTCQLIMKKAENKTVYYKNCWVSTPNILARKSWMANWFQKHVIWTNNTGSRTQDSTPILRSSPLEHDPEPVSSTFHPQNLVCRWIQRKVSIC